MAFRLFLACSFVLLARPQDILTFLQPFRPALVITVLATTALLFSGRGKDISAALATPESKRYLAFFLVMVLGIPFAYYRSIAFDGVLQRYSVNMLFFLLSICQINSLQRMKTFLWIVCLSTLVYGLFSGLLQSSSLGAGRLQAVGGVLDPNDTAYVLLALFPLCLFFLQFDNGSTKTLLAFVAICGTIATVLLTGSRGGMVAFGTVLVLLLFTNLGALRKAHKVLLLVTVLLGTSWLLVTDKVDAQRYLSISNISSDYNVTESGGRIALWKEAIDLTLANPLTGVGVDCYATANHQARLLRGATYFRWHAVHNSFLQIASEAGLVAFAIFLVICLRTASTFRSLSRIRLQSSSSDLREIRALGGLMFLGFSGNLVAGFFLSQGYSIFFTLYFALATVMVKIRGQYAATQKPPNRVGRMLTIPR